MVDINLIYIRHRLIEVAIGSAALISFGRWRQIAGGVDRTPTL